MDTPEPVLDFGPERGPPYPHFNRPPGFWPCVKSCLVGDSDKYPPILTEWTNPHLQFISNKYKTHNFQKTNNLILSPKMIREMVESAWANIVFFLHHLDPEIGRRVRRLKRLHLKIIKKRLSVVFNRTCPDNKLLPIYIYIYIRIMDTIKA